jgi:hypothetical protein
MAKRDLLTGAVVVYTGRRNQHALVSLAGWAKSNQREKEFV